jgi:FimV-like protein
MISLIVKSYLPVLLSISMICILIFIFGLMVIFKFINKPKVLPIKKSIEEVQFAHEKNAANNIIIPITNQDVAAIAGDNATSTRLDLARAYVETDNKIMAKKILEEVIAQGTATEKKEALNLLNLIAAVT